MKGDSQMATTSSNSKGATTSRKAAGPETVRPAKLWRDDVRPVKAWIPCECIVRDRDLEQEDGVRVYTMTCDKHTHREFAQGHDARLYSEISSAYERGDRVRVISRDGTKQAEGAAEDFLAWRPGLLSKLGNSAAGQARIEKAAAVKAALEG